MLNTNLNSLSSIAYRIMMAGMFKSRGPFPVPYQALAEEMFAVPERPADYNGQIDIDSFGSTIAVLVSGGVDSSILYWLARKQAGTRAQAFFVDVGQPYIEKEEVALHRLGIRYTKIDVGLGGMDGFFWKHIIPGRNFLCICLAAERITGGEVWFGALNGEMPDRGGDKSKRFIEDTNLILSHTLPLPVRVYAPLSEQTKQDAIANYLNDGGSKEWLMSTVSCFSNGGIHCGGCQACLRRALAFAVNNIEFESVQPVKLGCTVFIDKYKRLMAEALEKKDFSHYSERRCTQDLAAIKLL